MQTNSTSFNNDINAENVQNGKPNEVVDRNMMMSLCQWTFSQLNERNTNNKQAPSKGEITKLNVHFNNKQFRVTEALEKFFVTSTQLIKDSNFNSIKEANSLAM